MNVMIVLGGLTILVGLALLIGSVDGRSREAAWRRVAGARREIAAVRRDQEEWERAVAQCLEQPRCVHCPLHRFLDRTG
jgi:hypothetical protein